MSLKMKGKLINIVNKFLTNQKIPLKIDVFFI